MARPLSSKEIQRRIAAHRSGMPIAQMAKKFGTTRNAIYNFLQRRGFHGGEASCPTCGQKLPQPAPDSDQAAPTMTPTVAGDGYTGALDTTH